MSIMVVDSLKTVSRWPDVSVEEPLPISLVFLNSTDALRSQNPPPSHGVGARKEVTHIGGADSGSLLPPESDLVEIRQLDLGMRKTSPYGVQREAAIVLL